MRTLLASALFLLAAAVPAQTPPPDLPLTGAERSLIVEAVAANMESGYVDAEQAARVAAELRRALNAGEFDTVASSLKLVPAVNRFFAPLDDPHVRFGYQAKPQPLTVDPWAEESAEELAKVAVAASRHGGGIQDVQRLEGNIGLLKMVQWYDPSMSGSALGAAMSLLATTDALIIDLRESDGGAPEAVAYLESFFLPTPRVEVAAIYIRAKNLTRHFWTTEQIPGPRYLDKPVFVLTSKKTWSAAEGFAGQMQSFRNATVVGERTRGGRSRLGDWRVIHPHFAMFVPHAKAIDPRSGHELAPAVEPNVSAAAEDALRVARLLALRSLHGATGDPGRKAELEDAIAELEQTSN